jgi:hypothetical protein
VNGFGPIISVLGAPSKHSLTQSLLPVAATSPLLLPALIGWSASHLAKIGEPYASIAKIATEVTDRRVQSLLMAGATTGEGGVGDVSLEDKLWIVLMLGGIEVSPPVCVCKRREGTKPGERYIRRSVKAPSTAGQNSSPRSGTSSPCSPGPDLTANSARRNCRWR